MASVVENEKTYNSQFELYNIRKILSDVIDDSSMYLEVKTSFDNYYYFFLHENNDSITIDYIEIPKRTYLKEITNIYKGIENNIKTFSELFDSKEFEEYIKKYCYKGQIDLISSQEEIKEYIYDIENLDFSKDRPDVIGLDGHCLNLYIKKLNVKFWTWCMCTSSYYKPIINFINFILNKINKSDLLFSIIEH